jgi:predicted ester cyclase
MRPVSLRPLPLSALMLLLLASCAGVHVSTTESALEAENIQRVQRYWHEVWEKGNIDAVAEFYHPNAKHGDDFTIEGFQKSVQSQREAFPDFKVIIKDIFATGDKVITEVEYRITHTGRRMFGQDPLGKSIIVPGMDVFTFKEGKCINHQHVADHLDLVRQMGLRFVPTRDPAKAEAEVKSASENYLNVVRKLNSGMSYNDLVNTGAIDALGKILADEYLYTDPHGVINTKTEELDWYKENTVVLTSSDINDQKITVDGNTAIETGIIRFMGTNAGKPFNFTKRYTTTWIWRGGRWQIMADHASKMEK